MPGGSQGPRSGRRSVEIAIPRLPPGEPECEDSGTSAEIRLPRTAGVARSQAEDSDSARVEGGVEVILIVEDDVMVRSYVVGQIQSRGYRTHAGNATEAALSLANQSQQSVLQLLR
jgi:hypothetical protein